MHSRERPEVVFAWRWGLVYGLRSNRAQALWAPQLRQHEDQTTTNTRLRIKQGQHEDQAATNTRLRIKQGQHEKQVNFQQLQAALELSRGFLAKQDPTISCSHLRSMQGNQPWALPFLVPLSTNPNLPRAVLRPPRPAARPSSYTPPLGNPKTARRCTRTPHIRPPSRTPLLVDQTKASQHTPPTQMPQLTCSTVGGVPDCRVPGPHCRRLEALRIRRRKLHRTRAVTLAPLTFGKPLLNNVLRLGNAQLQRYAHAVTHVVLTELAKPILIERPCLCCNTHVVQASGGAFQAGMMCLRLTLAVCDCAQPQRTG